MEVAAVLVREPTNRFDPNAIAVHAMIEGVSPGAVQVGYLPREIAADIAPAIDRHEAQGTFVALRGTIIGGWDRADDQGHFGIWLNYDPADFA